MAGSTGVPGDHLRADARNVLLTWDHPEAGQRNLRQDYLAFLAAHPDAMWRTCRSGHLTASALVIDRSRSRVLLTLHPKVGRWLQLGGHCEPTDLSLHQAAGREAVEESGIAAVQVSPRPLRLDRHAVRCGSGMTEHLDVQYLAVVADTATAVISDESDDLQWFSIDALPDDLDASVRALVGQVAGSDRSF